MKLTSRFTLSRVVLHILVTLAPVASQQYQVVATSSVQGYGCGSIVFQPCQGNDLIYSGVLSGFLARGDLESFNEYLDISTPSAFVGICNPDVAVECSSEFSDCGIPSTEININDTMSQTLEVTCTESDKVYSCPTTMNVTLTATCISAPSSQPSVSSAPTSSPMIDLTYALEPDLEGTSSGIVAAIVLPIACSILGAIVWYLIISEKRAKKEEDKRRIKKYLAVVSAASLIAECSCALLYLSEMADNTRVLIHKSNPKCNVYIDSLINLTASEYYYANDAYQYTSATYRVLDCNAFVHCVDDYAGQQFCSLGNSFNVDYDGNYTLEQSDWLKDAVCSDLNNYRFKDIYNAENGDLDDMNDEVTVSATFQAPNALQLLVLLIFVCITYYPTALILLIFRFRKESSKDKEDSQTSTERLKNFLVDQLLRLWILCVSIFIPISSPSMGCDKIISGATAVKGGFAVLTTFAIVFVFGMAYLICCLQMWANPKLLKSIFLFVSTGLVIAQVTITYSSLTIENIWTLFGFSFNIPTLGLTLNKTTIRSTAYFCFQMIALLRTFSKLLDLMMHSELFDCNKGQEDQPLSSQDSNKSDGFMNCQY